MQNYFYRKFDYKNKSRFNYVKVLILHRFNQGNTEQIDYPCAITAKLYYVRVFCSSLFIWDVKKETSLCLFRIFRQRSCFTGLRLLRNLFAILRAEIFRFFLLMGLSRFYDRFNFFLY